MFNKFMSYKPPLGKLIFGSLLNEGVVLTVGTFRVMFTDHCKHVPMFSFLDLALLWSAQIRIFVCLEVHHFKTIIVEKLGVRYQL